MLLLERIHTLLRADLNDLIDKAEQPEKLLRQLLLDMQNQFMQVKTHVAMALADLHELEKKQKESMATQRGWMRKAEAALARNDVRNAGEALEGSLAAEDAARDLLERLEEQAQRVQLFRDGMQRLEQKMMETKRTADLLTARLRRERLAERAGICVASTLTRPTNAPDYLAQVDGLLAELKQRSILRG